jgi:CheY-like chemotaxis protein
MDGIEATRIIREEIGTDYARNIPIIALTANAIVGNEEMFLSHGFQAFISKPIDMAKLDYVLRQWVRDKVIEKELWGKGEDEHFPEKQSCDKKNNDSSFASIKIDGIDSGRALERFGGDESVLTDVLRSYATNTPSLLSSLRESLEAEHLTDYAIVVHGIKGSSYGIFAQEVGKTAETLEMSSKAGDLNAVKAGHFAFEELTETLIKDISKSLDAIDSAAGKPVVAEPDPALLHELREACKTFNMDRVDKAMDLLESLRYERGAKLIAWLRDQVSNMTFEEIADGEWPSE